MKQFGDVATYINGYAFKPSDYSDSGRQIIRIQDLTGNAYETNRYAGDLPEKYEVNKGDVLISWSASLGVYKWVGEPALLNQHIFKVIFNKLPVERDFFTHQAAYRIKNAVALMHGATMRHLTKKVFESLPFWLPSIEIQREVADRLNQLDRIIFLNEEKIRLLNVLVKSRFVEMFGGVVPAITKLGVVCDTYNGDRGKNYPSEKDKTDSGYPFINAGHIKGGRICFSEMDYITRQKYDSLSGGKIENGDILYCLRGSLGKCAIANFNEGTVASSLMIIRPKINRILSRYLLEALSIPSTMRQMKNANNGSSQPNLSAKSVRNFQIPVPSIEEQQRFVSFTEEVDKSKFVFREYPEKILRHY